MFNDVYANGFTIHDVFNTSGLPILGYQKLVISHHCWFWEADFLDSQALPSGRLNKTSVEKKNNSRLNLERQRSRIYESRLYFWTSGQLLKIS